MYTYTCERKYPMKMVGMLLSNSKQALKWLYLHRGEMLNLKLLINSIFPPKIKVCDSYYEEEPLFYIYWATMHGVYSLFFIEVSLLEVYNSDVKACFIANLSITNNNTKPDW